MLIKFKEIFKRFNSAHVNNIGCTSLFTEWTKILDEVDYHKT